MATSRCRPTATAAHTPMASNIDFPLGMSAPAFARNHPGRSCSVFNASHASGRSRASHARVPNVPVRRRISGAKLGAALSSLVLCRWEPAPQKLAVLYKAGLHRAAVLRTPVGPEGPELGWRNLQRVAAEGCQRRHRPKLLRQ